MVNSWFHNLSLDMKSFSWSNFGKSLNFSFESDVTWLEKSYLPKLCYTDTVISKHLGILLRSSRTPSKKLQAKVKSDMVFDTFFQKYYLCEWLFSPVSLCVWKGALICLDILSDLSVCSPTELISVTFCSKINIG